MGRIVIPFIQQNLWIFPLCADNSLSRYKVVAKFTQRSTIDQQMHMRRSGFSLETKLANLLGK